MLKHCHVAAEADLRLHLSHTIPEFKFIITIIIVIIIIINCNCVVTRWQWLFYMYTKHEIGYY